MAIDPIPMSNRIFFLRWIGFGGDWDFKKFLKVNKGFYFETDEPKAGQKCLYIVIYTSVLNACRLIKDIYS